MSTVYARPDGSTRAVRNCPVCAVTLSGRRQLENHAWKVHKTTWQRIWEEAGLK